MTLTALIFDFDGLIVDTESSSLGVVQEAYRRHGYKLSIEQWRLCVGSIVDPYDHLQRLIGPEVDLTSLRKEMEVRHRAEVGELGPRAGVVELVKEAAAAELRLAVASSASRRWVEGHLARIGVLEYFHAIRCRDDVRQASKTAGIYTVVVPNDVTRGWPFDHADRVIDSLHGVEVSGVDGWLAGAMSFA